MFKRININLISVALFCATLLVSSSAIAADLRRPISPSQPAWLIHIDAWTKADPQKVIELIPDDIKPHVIVNLAMSVDGYADGTFKRNPDAESLCRSWLRTCAQNRMWAVVQCASGAPSVFGEDSDVFEQFYKEFPNFLGWNYSEQYWGFSYESTCSQDERIAHFVDLIELANKYGGYLIESFCGEADSYSFNPVAQMKRWSSFAEACKSHTENFILCDKYTSKRCFYEQESVNLGAFVGGYAGNYGIRFDSSGWVGELDSETSLPEAAGIMPIVANTMLTGGTVIDGPELTRTQCYNETTSTTDGEGFTVRQWAPFPQFNNISIDLFRKIIDGTIAIPSRQEVIEATKVAIVNDIDNGNNKEMYAADATLYDGLYKMGGDGEQQRSNNTTWMKRTGRYPSIPIVADLADDLAQSIAHPINASDIANGTIWATENDKISYFNNIFPEEYSGDIFAAHRGNSWLIYNPYKDGSTANGEIPFQQYKAESIGVSLAPYSTIVMQEGEGGISLYMNNYRTDDTSLKTDKIVIAGLSNEQNVTVSERGYHESSNIKKSFANNTLTMEISHNGAMDISIGSGIANTALSSPDLPPIYNGTLQYEAECFDTKSVAQVSTNGTYTDGSISGYEAQGFVAMGTNAKASIRANVNIASEGNDTIAIRYMVPANTSGKISVSIDGVGAQSSTLSSTNGEWKRLSFVENLSAGTHTITISNVDGSANYYIDNLTITPQAESSGINDITIEDNRLRVIKRLTPKGIVIERGGRSYDVSGKRF